MNFNRDHTLVPWDTIDTVLLDMDGTLLDLNYDNQIFSHLLPSAFADYHSLTLEEARQQLNDHMTKLKGTMDFYRLDYWHKATKVDVLGLHAGCRSDPLFAQCRSISEGAVKARQTRFDRH